MINLAVALTSTYEKATVARIVGDTPEEMISQLTMSDLDLKHATYYAEDSIFDNTEKKSAVIRNEFWEHFEIDERGWDWNDVDNFNKFERNEYLIIEADGDIQNNYVLSNDRPASNFNWNFQFYNPLLVFASDYAGLYLPNIQSLVGKFGQDAVMIAPSAVPSKEFVRSFICNLRNERTVGQAYTEARNNYYRGVAGVDNWIKDDELIGLTLFSYNLYGMPTLQVSIPLYKETFVESKCKEYFEEYLSLQKTSLIKPAAEPQSFSKIFTFNTGNYEIINEGAFSIVSAENTQLNYEFDELLLPVGISNIEFPLKTVITDVSLLSLENPVELTVDNLPSWKGEIIDRNCYQNSQSASVGSSHTFSEDKELLTVYVNPVEIQDCQQGLLNLYHTVNFKVDYIPFSPLIFSNVESPSQVLPGETVFVNIFVSRTQDTEAEGDIIVRDVDNNIILKQEITTAIPQNTLQFIAPSEEGIYDYTIEFVKDDDSFTSTSFSIQTILVDRSLTIPFFVEQNQITADLKIANNQMEDVPLHYDYFLMKDNNVLQSGSEDVALNNGLNIYPIILNGLNKEDQSYQLLIDLIYSNKKETLSGTIVSNHNPILEPIAEIKINEAELVTITATANDLDNDQITYSINDARFARSGNEFTWQTTGTDNGEYTFTITASDGYLSAARDVLVIINKINDIPNDVADVSTFDAPGDQGGRVGITWNFDENAGERDILGYNIYLSETNDLSNAKFITSVPKGNKQLYIDLTTIDVNPSVPHFYFVCSYDEEFESCGGRRRDRGNLFDFSYDEQIDLFDFYLLASNIDSNDLIYDLNGDGIVDDSDVEILKQQITIEEQSVETSLDQPVDFDLSSVTKHFRKFSWTVEGIDERLADYEIINEPWWDEQNNQQNYATKLKIIGKRDGTIQATLKAKINPEMEIPLTIVLGTGIVNNLAEAKIDSPKVVKTYVGFSISFEGHGEDIDNDNIIAYEWDFGNKFVNNGVTITNQFVPIFITSTTYDGNLGGLAGADAICNQRAQTANLPGIYNAIVSTNTVNAKDRIPDGIYYNTKNEIIANNIIELGTQNAMQNPVKYDEFGKLAANEVWTGTHNNLLKFNGGYNCVDWTNNQDSNNIPGDLINNGITGLADSIQNPWSRHTPSCISKHPIYCVGQESVTQYTTLFNTQNPGDITFDNPGTYTINFRVQDEKEEWGNPSALTVEVLEAVEQDFSIQLKQGWNMLGIPMMVEDNSVQNVLKSIEGKYDRLFAFDNGWTDFAIGKPAFLNSLTTLNNQHGYWIFMLEDAELKITGLPSLGIHYNLNKDWNLIGVPVQQSITPTLIPNLIGIFMWDANTWKIYSPEKPPFLNTLTQLDPGYGYWVRVSEAGVWTNN